MLKNYFKTAWRNLARQKGLSFINVFGLSVGIACFNLFMLYAVNELNYDNFHENKANIFRVYQYNEAVGDNAASAMPYGPQPLGPSMKQDLPGIENYVRFLDNWGSSFIKTDNGVLRDNVSFADPAILTVFSFRLKYGQPSTALQGLQNIVLTESEAVKIFGKANVVGKTLQIQEDGVFVPFVVTAVAEDVPSNSTLKFTMLGNFNFFTTTKPGKHGVNNWNQISYQIFLQLKPGSTLKDDKQLLAAFRKKYFPNDEAEEKKYGYTGKGPAIWYGLQPLTEMHTNTLIDSDAIDIKGTWLLLAIATGVLLIACINFTTLAIGRSAGRAKEVGVRKVIGGTRGTLATQFLTESLLLAVLSGMLGLLLVNLLLPFFNTLSARNLQFSFTQFPQLIWLTAGLVLLVGVLAGSYPALVLSRFKVVEVLKTKIKVGGSNFFSRALVTAQFTLSATLIIATVIIVQQLRFMQTKNPGYNKDNVVDVDARGVPGTKELYALFKKDIAAYPQITAIAATSTGLGEGTGYNRSGFRFNGKDKQVYEYGIDPAYLDVLGLTLAEGRDFNAAMTEDTVTSVIINEAMMRDFGWTYQNVIGQRLKGYYENESDPRTPTVIGLVKDFNFLDVRQPVEPQMFTEYNRDDPEHFFVRIKAGAPSKAIEALQATWTKLAADYPFKYSFLDERLSRFYDSEVRWGNIVGWAGGISIFLACLGLLGLTALAAVNRTKEIGIRKVLGASVVSIMQLLSKDFLKLVGIAFVISAPLAWYFLHQWLQHYASRINIGWQVFIVTGVAIACIAAVTISIQAAKAAMANPVKSLRTE
jgi:putative ABC transport system permease protein